MAIYLKEDVVSAPGEPVHRTRASVPDYLEKAVTESLKRGRDDAKSGGWKSRLGRAVNSDPMSGRRKSSK